MYAEVLCREQSALQLSEVLPGEAESDIWIVTNLQSTALSPGGCLGPKVTQERSFQSRTREKGDFLGEEDKGWRLVFCPGPPFSMPALTPPPGTSLEAGYSQANWDVVHQVGMQLTLGTSSASTVKAAAVSKQSILSLLFDSA